jgi:hypothetical protein
MKYSKEIQIVLQRMVTPAFGCPARTREDQQPRSRWCIHCITSRQVSVDDLAHYFVNVREFQKIVNYG